MAQIEEVAFPRLTSAELALVKPLATPCDYADGETIFRAGQADIDLYIVESGQIEIRNPTDGDRVIVTHDAGPVLRRHRSVDRSSGDRDCRRAGRNTCVAQFPTAISGRLLNRVPSFGEKLIVAFTRRRELLSQLGTLGLACCRPGTLPRHEHGPRVSL